MNIILYMESKIGFNTVFLFQFEARDTKDSGKEHNSITLVKSRKIINHPCSNILIVEIVNILISEFFDVSLFSNKMNYLRGFAVLMADNIPVFVAFLKKGVTYLMVIMPPLMLCEIGLELLASFLFLTSGS